MVDDLAVAPVRALRRQPATTAPITIAPATGGNKKTLREGGEENGDHIALFLLHLLHLRAFGTLSTIA